MGDADYDAYMRSHQWRARRLSVIRRCRGICERCKRLPVSSVHHLTYARFGNELLEDLLGVCVKCHRTLHH
jgi:5-methylcytosine-specific restriction endonuclease McrA